MIGSLRNRRFSAGLRWPDEAQSRTRPWNSIITKGLSWQRSEKSWSWQRMLP